MTTPEQSEKWKERRDGIKQDIIRLANGEHEFCKLVREEISKEQATGNIPDSVEAYESYRDAMIAGCIAIAAAHLAYMTDGDFTEEGNYDPYINLARWSGELFEKRMANDLATEMMARMGMGQN